MSDEKKSVEVAVTIDADADAVWRAVSEGEGIKRWFCNDARVTPGAGGAIWMSFGEGMDWETPIEIWEPGRHLRTADPAPSTLAVDYFIESERGQTVFRIVHSGFGADAWDEELDTLNAGWRTFAALLKHYLEVHPGKSRTVVSFRHPVVKAERSVVYPRMLRALGVPQAGEGERFEGPLFNGIAAVSKPPVNLSGPITDYDDAFVMIEIEPGRGQCRPAVWVSLFGDAGREAAALEPRLREAVTREFSEF